MKKNDHRNSVQVEALTRPIKYAYLVPIDESESSQWILDSIFYESYTRWGGAHTLIIPTSPEAFQDDKYEAWLSFYDPDVIYSYVAIEKKLLVKIDNLCSPISIIQHEVQNVLDGWRKWLPKLDPFYTNVTSLSTLLSPSVDYERRSGELERRRILVTQFDKISEERFLSDNFGISHDLSHYTNPVAGLFETLCFYNQSPDVRINAGTEQIEDLNYIFSGISSGLVTTFCKLASVHSEGIPKLDGYPWNSTFTIIIGNSYQDRINFWNGRNLSATWLSVPACLILREESFNDDIFVRMVGDYLNKHNHLNRNSGQGQVTLKSSSLDLGTMESLLNKLKQHSHNNLILNKDEFNLFEIPSTHQFNRHDSSRIEAHVFKLNEKNNVIEAVMPEHFKYTPPKYESFLNKGTWAIELDIERQNNLSKYSNVLDSWELPRRSSVGSTFTRRLNKVSKKNRLVLIPEDKGNDIFGKRKSVKRIYDLSFPSDERFFRHVISKPSMQDRRDPRASLTMSGYEDISISDKGQNLRGIISMFNKFSDSYELLTDKLWRTVLRKFYLKQTIGYSEIFGEVPSTFEFKKEFCRDKGLSDLKNVNNLLKANFLDTLEYLVLKRIFFQVHKWRCQHCGHINIISIDELKKINECNICNLEYYSPIDLEWQFKVNSFVGATLCERHGLPVLWALGWLHQDSYNSSFYYLPEVDLYPDRNNLLIKEEIDILCVKEGKLCAVEVKKSAIQLTQKPEEVQKFIKKMKMIRPDDAYLMFEMFSEKTEEHEQVRNDLKEVIKEIEDQLKTEGINIKCIVAETLKEYSNVSSNLGYQGDRVEHILYGF